MTRSVRVVFTRRHHPGSVLLRSFLWSPWSHVGLIDGGTVIEAVGGAGVRVRPLADMLAEASRYEIVDMPARDPQAVIAAARAQVGKPYDWGGVVGVGFRRRWQDDDAWFCSELVAYSFAAGGSPLMRGDAWRITPRDLYLPIFGRLEPVGA